MNIIPAEHQCVSIAIVRMLSCSCWHFAQSTTAPKYSLAQCEVGEKKYNAFTLNTALVFLYLMKEAKVHRTFV